MSEQEILKRFSLNQTIPRLEITNPCCELAFNKSYKITQEFAHILDFHIDINEVWRISRVYCDIILLTLS